MKLKAKASSIVETKSLYRNNTLNNYISKIPIGTDGEYILGYTTSQMHKCGIKDSVLLVNYEWRYLVNYFDEREKLSVNIGYCDEKGIWSINCVHPYTMVLSFH